MEDEQLIQTYLQQTLKKTFYKTPRFHPLDFYCCVDDNNPYSQKEFYVEVKGRDYSSYDFEDTVIGINKINYSSCQEIPTYFYFVFTDKILEIKYSDETFKNYDEICLFGKKHLRIPIKDCKEILSVEGREF